MNTQLKKGRIIKTVSITPTNEGVWNSLANKSYIVNQLLEVASRLEDPNSISAILRGIKP